MFLDTLSVALILDYDYSITTNIPISRNTVLNINIYSFTVIHQ